MFNRNGFVAAIILGCLGAAAASAATVFETTQLAAATAAADVRLPAPMTFQVATAGSYTITLTDLRLPQELSALRAIVTRDLEIVAQLEVTYPAALAAAAAKNFTATPGTYRVHVLGTVADGSAGGGFGVNVAPATGGTALLDHADVLAGASAPDSGLSTSQASFELAQAGTYRLVVTDLAFPVQLASTQALLLQDTVSGPVVVPVTQGSFTGTPGTYQLLIVASATAPELAGLYSVRVDSGPATAAIYQATQPVGNLTPGESVAIAAAGQHTLALADAVFPAALDSMAGIVTQDGGVLATLGAAGTVNFAAVQGTAQIYSRAEPNADAGVGAYSVRLTRGAQSVYADVLIADASSDASTPAIYAVESSAAVAAGSYQFVLEDFGFPTAFAALKGAAVQGATLTGVLDHAGTSQVTLQAALLKILIAVKPPIAGSHQALFGMTVTPSAGGAIVLESTQGVGGLFRTHLVQIATPGLYDLTLRDLVFPAAMPTAALAITRGTALVGQVFGSGTVTRQQLAAGTYVLNFLGEPAQDASYGTYGLRVADSPPQPTVTLSATATSVTSGQQATLNWSSTNATTCTAANGWSGTKSTSGSQLVGPLNANATFELSCTGPGGTGTASAVVTVSAPRAQGGGGAIGWQLLIALGLLAGARFAGRPGDEK